MKYLFLVILTVFICLCLGKKLKFITLAIFCAVIGFGFSQVCDLESVKITTHKIGNNISFFLDKIDILEKPSLVVKEKK